MVYSSVNTHLLHETIVLAVERIIVVQILIAAGSFFIFAAILGITDSPSLLTVSLFSVLLQTADAILITTVILNWERTSFFITPDEVVVRRGVVELKETIYKYADIDSIELSQDSLGKVLNYGSIYFYSQSAKEEVGITNIPKPQFYFELVKGFKDAYEATQPDADDSAAKPNIS